MINMYCKNMSKCLNKKFKCKIRKAYIDYRIDCKNCSDFILVKNKGINKVSKKHEIVKSNIYNQVFARDKGKCRLCGSRINLHLHHIDGRSKNLTNNINNCIMLCDNCHLNKVHANQKKYRPILKELIQNGL